MSPPVKGWQEILLGSRIWALGNFCEKKKRGWRKEDRDEAPKASIQLFALWVIFVYELHKNPNNHQLL